MELVLKHDHTPWRYAICHGVFLQKNVRFLLTFHIFHVIMYKNKIVKELHTMKTTSHLISAAMTLALGILFVILKAEVVGICITLLGVALIVLAVLDLIKGFIAPGIVKILLAVCVLLIGWLLLDVALLVLGIVLLAYSIVEILKLISVVIKLKKFNILAIVLGLIEPALGIVASVFLITSRGAAIEWTVIVAGIVLIINGVCAAVRAFIPEK